LCKELAFGTQLADWKKGSSYNSFAFSMLCRQSLENAWQLAFMPISIRFDTYRPEVFYEGLARRLAEIMGEALPSEAIRGGDGFRDAVRDLLDRIDDRRVIIIIDGSTRRYMAASRPRSCRPITQMPPNLRVLLSARWQVGDKRRASGNVQISPRKFTNLRKRLTDA
jgi:hypothetical protein